MVGITKCGQVSLPETGSHRSVTENSMISMSAKKKFGSACPTTASGEAQPVDPAVAEDGGEHAERDREGEREERATSTPSSNVVGSLLDDQRAGRRS